MSLDWLYTAISYVLGLWHALFSRVLNPDGGVTWALSILFLVVTVRILLFRFFIRQVKSQRAMQELQPEIAVLKKQFGSDRQGMAKAQQDLFKERGVNPLAGCLPVVLQAPVFIALLHVLRRLKPGAEGLYSWSAELTDSASKAKFLGAPISSSFSMSGDKESAILSLTGGSYTSIRTVALILMVVMSITTYVTQKQIMRKSGPVVGQAAMIQKFMLYVIPASLFVSGFFFPIGVLIYWFMNNLWTMGQQFYILKKMPPTIPGAATERRSTVDPALLAPKPGAKPTQPKSRRTSTTGSTATTGSTGSSAPSPVSVESGKAGAGVGPAPGRKPTPGKRPPNARPKRKRR